MIRFIKNMQKKYSKAKEQKEVKQGQKEFISDWLSKIDKSREHFAKDFARMEKDAKFITHLGHSDEELENYQNYYVANKPFRLIISKRDKIYAKNPKIDYKLRPLMAGTYFDGSLSSLKKAEKDALSQDPALMQNAESVIDDAKNVLASRKYYDNVGQTLVSLMEYQLDMQKVDFKASMKTVIGKSLVKGLAFVKLNYENNLDCSVESTQESNDYHQRSSYSESIDKDDHEYEKEVAEQSLHETGSDTISYEGLLLTYPEPDKIIVDKSCKSLNTLAGADFIVQVHMLTPQEVKQTFSIDLKDKIIDSEDNRKEIFEVWDRKTRTVFFITKDHDGFLQEPETPVVDIKRFYPFYAYIPNDIETNSIYKPSDVSLIKSQAHEFNRARNNLVDDRKRNILQYATKKGSLSDDDLEKLANAEDHQIVELESLGIDANINNILQVINKPGTDPNKFHTNFVDEDIYSVLGTSSEGAGIVGRGSATQAAIAEGGRTNSIQSNIDDLDTLLNQLFEDASRVLLLNFDSEYVKEILGAGAVWPEWSRQEVANQIGLQIQAGSTGKPNKQLMVSNIERLMPQLLQIPGVKPEKLLDVALKGIDENLNVLDFYDPSLPSAVGHNQQSRINGASQMNEHIPTTDNYTKEV
ncbi:MAG: hypothetical protein GY793_08560 [Proteobacteria bacterium]|nr:hypothetical protein [Pseudomonadota bacterium]